MTPKVNRRTKIVATVGPGSESADMIARLIQAGVNVFRLNFSHGTADQHTRVAKRIRKQASIAGVYVGILADLQGPKIRISSFRDEAIQLAQGDRFRLDLNLGEGEGDSHGVGLDYRELCTSVSRGDILLLDDGRLRLRVETVTESAVDCTVLIGGKLSSRKGINRLGGGLAAPALTSKDMADIDDLARVEPDFVAVSFVSSAEDIYQTRKLLQKHNLESGIIAKIERAEVVADENVLNGIIRASLGVMVARGDLGVEVGDAQLIGIQKSLIAKARAMDRVVITATQMMESMIDNPMPTRAEVFDVANAVLDGTDAVMLSAETAVGKYPVEVVTAMSEAALGAERQSVTRTSRYRLDRQFADAQETIAMSAIYAANHYGSVRGIACLTESGSTPLLMSRLSSGLPIFGLSSNAQTLQKLSLCRGVVPLFFDASVFAADEVESRAIEFLMDDGYLFKGDSILLTKGTEMGQSGSTNIMKILPVN
ncbi:pyruvate kinase [Pseudohalioglobus sediminis]|uniref:Pyruvate kinase n=1 Tax=Pseudohalioglobus sediminis TaxID=2606449 RepID=A0A5B0WU34_9GAMM|nr:pyruvate kinase [Pseudohalioglobus sediminis]KAA1189701.1 pyruvate kinase [Pseudohalioglobus sediminis]